MKKKFPGILPKCYLAQADEQAIFYHTHTHTKYQQINVGKASNIDQVVLKLTHLKSLFDSLYKYTNFMLKDIDTQFTVKLRAHSDEFKEDFFFIKLVCFLNF